MHILINLLSVYKFRDLVWRILGTFFLMFVLMFPLIFNADAHDSVETIPERIATVIMKIGLILIPVLLLSYLYHGIYRRFKKS